MGGDGYWMTRGAFTILTKSLISMFNLVDCFNPYSSYVGPGPTLEKCRSTRMSDVVRHRALYFSRSYSALYVTSP